MADYRSVFEGKKITVMGLGLLGRGVGDAKFLAENGAELLITDLKSEEDLQPSVEALKGFPNVTFRLGGHDLADFRDRDFILKAAGIPFDSPFIAEAEKHGISVKMSASWFLEIAGIPSVGVTGTRGKSTTTLLLDAIMRAAGMRVLLGGNVRGVSTLALLPEVTKDSIALMELDSWQLQGFGEGKMSPDIAIFTTFMTDHMNYYKGDMDRYLDDKAQIFLNQKSDDTLVIGTQVAELIKQRYGRRIAAKAVIADPGNFPEHWHIKLLGVHNLLNAMCAIEAARALGIDEEVIEKAVADFSGAPGRLEFLREVDGVSIYNDTTSTTPEATLAAFRAIPGSRAVLIMGGADKSLDMEELAKFIPVYAKKVILLSGSGTKKMVDAHPDLFGSLPVYDRLEEALEAAMHASEPGDLVLFSPAFASFGAFKNEFDRGDQFTELVKKL